MVYELNGRKIICIFGNALTLKIILRNEIGEITACSKLQLWLQLQLQLWLPN